MFDRVQFIKDKDQTRFAIIPIEDYLFLQELLTDEEKLADYLDYLHVQKVKATSETRLSLSDVKRELSLE